MVAGEQGLFAFLGLLDEVAVAGAFSLATVKTIAAAHPSWDPLRTTDDNGATALHHLVGVEAAVDGDSASSAAAIDAALVEVYRYFLGEKNREADLSSFIVEYPLDVGGESLLHYAARGGRLVLAEALLNDIAAGADNREGKGAVAIARAAIAAPDAESGATPFHFAAKNGHTALLRLFLQYDTQNGDDETSSATPLFLLKDGDGMSPAIYAAGSGNVAAFSFLLEEGAGAFLRRQAADSSSSAVAAEARAYALAKDSDGTSTLHMAAFSGNVEMLKFIVDCANNNSFPPAKDLHVLPADCPLLSSGAAASADRGPLSDARGQTPLHFAAMAGAPTEVVDFLLRLAVASSSSGEEGAASSSSSSFTYAIDVSAPTAEGAMTALHYAAAGGEEELMAVLLSGRSDAAIALCNGSSDLPLSFHRADAAAKDAEGMTAAESFAERQRIMAEEDEEDCCGEGGDCCDGGDEGHGHDHGHGHSHSGGGCCGGH